MLETVTVCHKCGHRHLFTTDTTKDFDCQQCGEHLTRQTQRIEGEDV